MPQLEQINTFISQLFWLAIVFTCIYVFLARFFIPRISSIVGEREIVVKNSILEAETVLGQQKALKAEIGQILSQARNEGAETKQVASKKAEIYLQSQIIEFEKKLGKDMAREEEKLARLKSKLEQEITMQAELLGKEILKTIIPTDIKTTIN